jgi:WD40 repeat protein
MGFPMHDSDSWRSALGPLIVDAPVVTDSDLLARFRGSRDRATGWSGTLPRLALAMAAALLVAAIGFGQPEPSKSAANPDGVPLPEGAIARLGSARFRHGGEFNGLIAFSPDGRQLATGDNSGVSVFETSTGRLQRHFRLSDEQRPRVIRFVAEGKELAIGTTGYKTAEFTVFNLTDGKAVASSKFSGATQIFVIDVTRDGSQVLVEDRFAKVYLWDVKTSKELWAFDHPEAAFTLPMTADGKSFILAMSRKAELRDATTGKKVAEFPTPGPKFTSLYHAAAISPDGKLATSTESGDAVAILKSKGADAVRTFKGDRELTRLVFAPDSRYLVGLGYSGTLVWDATAKAGAGPIATLPASSACGFSPDGKTLALDEQGAVTLWKVGEWKPLPQSADPASPVQKVRFSADGKQVIAYQRGWITWPAGGGAATRVSDDSGVHPDRWAALSADGRVGVDVLYDPAPGAVKLALRVTHFATGKVRRIALDESGWLPIHISRDGRFVWVSGSDITAWDTDTGEIVLRQPRSKDRFLHGAELAKDGKSILQSVAGVWRKDMDRDLLGPSYDAVYVTNHKTGHEWKMDPIPWSIYSGGAVFTRDGSKLIVSGRYDDDWKKNCVSIWDVQTGRRLVSCTREAGRLESVSLSGDGRSLLVGDRVGKLVLIEVATGLERAAFQHGGMVLSSAFHPDGTKIVSSSPEAPVYVWDVLGEPGKWDAARADAIWSDLSSTDAKVAFAAMRKLQANPDVAIGFLNDRVRLPAVPEEAKVTEWIKQLDSPKFAEREKAQKDATVFAEVIRRQLASARKTASVEAGERIDQLLKSVADLTPDRLRHVRACETLEWIGTPEATRVLKAWGSGPEGARLTAEAKESIARIGRQ